MYRLSRYSSGNLHHNLLQAFNGALGSQNQPGEPLLSLNRQCGSQNWPAEPPQALNRRCSS